LHQAVILLVTDLGGEEQVAALESALENQRAVLPALQPVASAAIPSVLDKAAIAKLVEGLRLPCVDVALELPPCADYRLRKGVR
jgi:hypothetical protein